jgi:hypothetical protein
MSGIETIFLDVYVTNPFYSLFAGPNALTNLIPSMHNQLSNASTYCGGFLKNSQYNTLQLKYEKRYSGDLYIIGSYTMAKQIDDLGEFERLMVCRMGVLIAIPTA